MAKLILALVLGLGLAGCSAAGGRSSENAGPSSAAQPAAGGGARSVNTEGLTIYLQTMRALIEGDPVVQADAFRSAAQAADLEPTTTNRLNLALALATPGHPSSNAGEAQRALSELAASDTLLPEERILAVVHLKEVEQRLILDVEARRLQAEMAAARSEQNTQSAQRLQALAEDNRRLRLELDEAREKLDAITNIERSIRERENGSNPQ